MGGGGKLFFSLFFGQRFFFHLIFWLQTNDKISRVGGLLKVFS